MTKTELIKNIKAQSVEIGEEKTKYIDIEYVIDLISQLDKSKSKIQQSYNETKKIFNTISDSLSEKYVNIDNSRQLLYTPVHTFINDRTAITLSRNSAGPLERIVLNYYSMTYWNKLHENSEEDENFLSCFVWHNGQPYRYG